MIKDIQDIVDHLKTITGSVSNPVLECEFFLSITLEDEYGLDSTEDILIDSFTIPNLGINFNLNGSFLGIVTPDLSFSSMNLTFLVPANQIENQIQNPIFKAYYNQFDSDGLLLEKPPKYSASIFISVQDIYPTVSNLFKFTGCRFSNPIPTANPKSTEYSKFQTTISYNSFIKS